MQSQKFKIEYFVTDRQECPIKKWIDSFKDTATDFRIRNRLARILLGNLGEHHSVKDGVSELILDFGPGYRIYYGKIGRDIILLLYGGDKSSQKKDIEKAVYYWNMYLNR